MQHPCIKSSLPRQLHLSLRRPGFTLEPVSGLSVFLQGLDQKVVQAAYHGPGVIDESCGYHGILIDLKYRDGR